MRILDILLFFYLIPSFSIRLFQNNNKNKDFRKQNTVVYSYEHLLNLLNSNNSSFIEPSKKPLKTLEDYKYKLKIDREIRKNNFDRHVTQVNDLNKNHLFHEEFEFKPFEGLMEDSCVTINYDKDKKYVFTRPNPSGNKKSENFEVYRNTAINFDSVGGYSKVKSELRQCLDTLKDHTKYSKYNVRIPQGLIVEGPPGTGKTLLAKSLAGESDCAFIPVSGSDFQEKYVGVGPTRIKELFQLARQNLPCIIFIDEIDALGRKRSGDGESSSSERDSTLNALLVELDGFKNSSGIFLVAATNRIDLLDPALTRPGRIDKKINIGLPDIETRKAILKIHISGKPHDDTVIEDDLIEMTGGFSGAQIENLLNEAMLFALRENRVVFNSNDINVNFNKMIAGWQPNDHEFTDNMIDRIVVHEIGHAIAGVLSKYHSKVSKVVINLSSPRSPGYTIFESNPESIFVRESLFENLIILLSGRVAEEVIYGVSFTTGAINDLSEALKLAEKMVVHYGMGARIIYPSSSDKYKQLIDDDVATLIDTAYKLSTAMLSTCTDLINETSIILKEEKMLKGDTLTDIISFKYPDILELTNKIYGYL